MPIKRFNIGNSGGIIKPKLEYTKVSRHASNFDLGTEYTTVSWDTEVNDDLGCWESGSPTRLAVPDGKIKARICGFVIFDDSSSGTRGAKIIKNGSTEICATTITPRNEGGMYIDTGIISVTEGDYFELQAYSGSSSIELRGNDGWGHPSWFEISFTDNMYTKNTKLFKYSYQTFSDSWATMSWSGAKKDDAGIWDPANPTLIKIPKGYKKARISFYLDLSYAASYPGYNIAIHKTGETYPLGASSQFATYSRPGLLSCTGWIDVAENDSFYAVATASVTIAAFGQSTNGGNTYFMIELLPDA